MQTTSQDPNPTSKWPRLTADHEPVPQPPGTLMAGDVDAALEAHRKGTATAEQQRIVALPEIQASIASSRRLMERVKDRVALALTDPRQLGELDAQGHWRDRRHRAHNVHRAQRRVAERGLRAVPRTPRARERGGQTPARTRGSRRAGSSSSTSSADPGGGESDPEPPSRGPAPRPRFSRPWRTADGLLAKRIATLDRLGVAR